ncbi:MAG: carbohydrate ABC transporter permease [Thermoanaerobacterium sp.]|nr:carbohydrate ABC transporter permease [Thermoanaerobacterium sp.]
MRNIMIMIKEKIRKINMKTIRKVILPHAVLILFGIVFFIPFLWMLTTSFKTPANIFKFPPQWIPKPFMWQNYMKAYTSIPFMTYLRNTIILAVTPVFGQVFASALVAYSFSKIPWKGSKILFGIALSTVMLPGQVTMIPIYIIWAKLGLINTFTPFIVPSFFGSAYNIFLIRQFFMTIPDNLLDSARIDGASEFTIFYKIMLPLSKPVLTTVALFTFIGGWNDFMGPLIYLTDGSKYPLSVGLQAFLYQHSQQWELLMAASVLFTIPMIIAFFVGQKQFIQGIVMTGFK